MLTFGKTANGYTPVLWNGVEVGTIAKHGRPGHWDAYRLTVSPRGLREVGAATLADTPDMARSLQTYAATLGATKEKAADVFGGYLGCPAPKAAAAAVLTLGEAGSAHYIHAANGELLVRVIVYKPNDFAVHTFPKAIYAAGFGGHARPAHQGLTADEVAAAWLAAFNALAPAPVVEEVAPVVGEGPGFFNVEGGGQGLFESLVARKAIDAAEDMVSAVNRALAGNGLVTRAVFRDDGDEARVAFLGFSGFMPLAVHKEYPLTAERLLACLRPLVRAELDFTHADQESERAALEGAVSHALNHALADDTLALAA